MSRDQLLERQPGVVGSQQIEFAQLANLNEISSLNNDNATAAVGMSSMSGIENLLLIEESSNPNMQSAEKPTLTGKAEQGKVSFLSLTAGANTKKDASLSRSHEAA